MNSRQFFFVCLILLSIAMGAKWLKNRPKTPQKPSSKTRQAVSFNDLQVRETPDEDDESEESDKDSSNKKSKSQADSEANKEENESDKETLDEGEEEEEEEETEKEVSPENPEQQIASDTMPITASDTLVLDSPLKDDPIMQEYFKITRNPFETSPYAQLVEKLRLEAELAIAASQKKDEIKEVKKVTVISNALTGSIETSKGLRAIIDGNLYLKGDMYRQHKITEINNEVVIMDTESETFIVTKPGVMVNIDEKTGEYTITDTFEQ